MNGDVMGCGGLYEDVSAHMEIIREFKGIVSRKFDMLLLVSLDK
jgi:hypothetical protein